MSEEKHSLRDRLAPALPTVLLILLILQPLLDILSYWTDRLGMANTLTLLLRFAVLPPCACSASSPRRARKPMASPPVRAFSCWSAT